MRVGVLGHPGAKGYSRKRFQENLELLENPCG